MWDEFRVRMSPFRIFSIQDVKKQFPSMNLMNLVRWQEKGYILKLRNLWYAFNDAENSENMEWLAANLIYSTPPYINESHLDSVDISKPVYLAEIAPDPYNLIDGHHRAEKACRLGMNTINAFRLQAFQHIQFLKSRETYEKYVAYWNDNVKELKGTERKLFLEDRCMDDFNPEHFDKDGINQQLKKWEAVWLNKWK